MRLERSLLAAAATSLVALASCGGTQTAPTPTAPEPATPAAPAPAVGGVAWDDMSRAQKMERMKTVVFPKMKAAFAGFDPEDFKDFKCVTCHGDGATDKTFKMPNPKLPKLPADAEGFKTLAEKEPEAVKFMSETVVPQMAAMLGEEPYDHATGTGFGCFECHTKK